MSDKSVQPAALPASVEKRVFQPPTVTEWIVGKPWYARVGFGLVLFAVVALLKARSGPEVVFSAVFLVPVAFFTWCVSWFAGLGTAAASTLTLLLVNVSDSHKYPHPLIPYWNAAMDLGVFLIVVLILREAKTLYRRERELSREDFLTGLANGRAFWDSLAAELIRARRYPHSMTIAYIDVDDFKRVNDTYGHQAGDVLLALIGSALRDSVRDVDMVARLGGDEFALLLPETGSDAARLVLEKVRTSVDETIARHLPYAVTLSIGAVSFVTPPKSVEEMIQCADQVMYTVKRNGKAGLLHRIAA